MQEKVDVALLEHTLAKLTRAYLNNSSDERCRRLWSEFIRIRDGFCCVACGAEKRVSAHHICRRSFLADAELNTGNGITLCVDCHREAHVGFNGRPDLSMPMDAQGGEKLDTMERLYGTLLEDATARGILRDDFYFISDIVLMKFKMFQGFTPTYLFPGPRLRQAYEIWRSSSPQVIAALVKANFLD